MGQAEIGRIFGIAIVVDGSFLLLALLFGMQHFMSGSAADLSYGALLVAGVALSILLHELGHALAAYLFGVPTTYIELNGLGGLCHFGRPLPPDRLATIVVLLAGPLANLLLWQAFASSGTLLQFSQGEGSIGLDRAVVLLLQLSQLNMLLLVFNLLPAHPLDGGRALAQFLSVFAGFDRAMRLVAYLGMAVALWLVWLGFSGAYFALLIALVLFQANLQALAVHRTVPQWRRWN